jgi:phosphatidylglycerol:prolipoprotein diacylglycerol transferase
VHPRLVNIPIPFTSLHLPIHSYGFMMMLGFLAGIYLARERARREGVEPSFMMDLATVLLLSGIVGARLAYIMEAPAGFSWKLFNVFDGGLSPLGALLGGAISASLAYHLPISKGRKSNPAVIAACTLGGAVAAARIFHVAWHADEYEHAFEIFKVYRGGLSFYGGLILATGTGIVYIKRTGHEVAPIADISAPSLAIGLGFGRVGCFLNGCCYGKITTSRLGIRFPGDGRGVTSPAWLDHYNRKLITFADHKSLPVHPTQLYHALAALLIFCALVVYYRRRRAPAQVFLLFGALYSSTRFLLEFYRGDMEPLPWGLTLYQTLAIPIFAVCTVWWGVLQLRASSDSST